MKTPKEIIDDFCDDYFSGVIQIDPKRICDKLNQSENRADHAYLEMVDKDAKSFLIKLRNYQDETNKEIREETARPLLREIEQLRMGQLFIYADDSVKMLKLELEKCKQDNRRLGEELLWFKRSEKISPEGVKPNAD